MFGQVRICSFVTSICYNKFDVGFLTKTRLSLRRQPSQCQLTSTITYCWHYFWKYLKNTRKILKDVFFMQLMYDSLYLMILYKDLLEEVMCYMPVVVIKYLTCKSLPRIRSIWNNDSVFITVGSLILFVWILAKQFATWKSLFGQ